MNNYFCSEKRTHNKHPMENELTIISTVRLHNMECNFSCFKTNIIALIWKLKYNLVDYTM